VELWRIGASPAAPRFNIISKPNNWSQSVKQAANAIDDAELSETRLMQRDYWQALNVILNAKGGPVLGNKKPQPQSWMPFPIGRSSMYLSAVMLSHRNQVRAELYMTGLKAKAYFGLLRRQKDAIERELGYPMVWEELPERQDSRISVYLDATDPKSPDEWKRQHEWLADRLNDLHKVFSLRVKRLNADDWQPEDNQ
jgi:hypothetical protein